jgi:inner membrane protein
MPSPVGHILAGAAVYLGATPKEDRSRFTLGAALFGSILPDFDFFPGLFVGKLSTYHHGLSHSLIFAVAFGAVVLILARHAQETNPARAAIIAGLSYASHVILDFLGTNEGTKGVPMLWPFSNEKFGLDLGLLGYFRYSDSGIWSVLRFDNILVVAREVVFVGSLPLFFLWRERRRNRSVFKRPKSTINEKALSCDSQVNVPVFEKRKLRES